MITFEGLSFSYGNMNEEQLNSTSHGKFTSQINLNMHFF